MKRVTEHLSKIEQNNIKKRSLPPIDIKGTGNGIPLTYDINIPSAQIKSAIMFSALNTNGTVKIKEFKQPEITLKICLNRWDIISKSKKINRIDSLK